MTPTRSPEDLLPLRPVETLILSMLTAGERHGYGIRQDVLDHTRGKIELEAGSLYRLIRRMESEGLVEAASARRANDDERRIYYHLSPFGRRVIAAEMLRLRELVRLAEDRRLIAPARA